jgi:hypothetical protein
VSRGLGPSGGSRRAPHDAAQACGCRAWAGPGPRPGDGVWSSRRLGGARRLRSLGPVFGPSGLLMRAAARALDHGNRPLPWARGRGLRLQGREAVRADASALPAVAAARDGAPRTIPCGHIAPGSARAEAPEDPLAERAVIMGGSPDLGSLGWEQWVQPLPLDGGQISSVHTLEYTEQSRICKHALVYHLILRAIATPATGARVESGSGTVQALGAPDSAEMASNGQCSLMTSSACQS